MFVREKARNLISVTQNPIKGDRAASFGAFRSSEAKILPHRWLRLHGRQAVDGAEDLPSTSPLTVMASAMDPRGENGISTRSHM